jgi:hypothetical protein
VAADVRGDFQTASEPPILRDMKWPMKHLWVLPLISVLLLVGLAVGPALLAHPRPVTVSCDTEGAYSGYSREAEKSCREDPGIGGGVADGDGFSYGWTCEDGTLTRFSFS